MSNEADLKQLEINIDVAKRKVERMNRFRKLTQNEDFKVLIEEDYFVQHASRIVLLRAAPAMQTEERQIELNNDLTAIGYLKQYFVAIMQEGMTAERAIDADEKTREEILSEDLS